MAAAWAVPTIALAVEAPAGAASAGAAIPSIDLWQLSTGAAAGIVRRTGASLPYFVSERDRTGSGLYSAPLRTATAPGLSVQPGRDYVIEMRLNSNIGAGNWGGRQTFQVRANGSPLTLSGKSIAPGIATGTTRLATSTEFQIQNVPSSSPHKENPAVWQIVTASFTAPAGARSLELTYAFNSPVAGVCDDIRATLPVLLDV